MLFIHRYTIKISKILGSKKNNEIHHYSYRARTYMFHFSRHSRAKYDVHGPVVFLKKKLTRDAGG